MNKIYFQFFLCFLFITKSYAQCDYSTPVYSVGSDKGLLYGIATAYNGVEDSLFLDVYYPIGSPEQKKPMIIWAFGGGFFQGVRQDLASICQDIAARGIVAVTIDYRLGFTGPPGLNPPFAFDKAEILRAAYRGILDMKGAIRFMKAKHLEYEIDLERVWSGGVSAGAIVALNAAFLDKESEKPAELGTINPIGNQQRNDLGKIEGSLNINGYDESVQGVFNFFGAVLDTKEIDVSDQIAVFSYHQTNDPVVPCKINTPYYGISFIAANYPVVHGTCAITDYFVDNHLDPLYWESWIYPGSQHSPHNQDAVINFMLQHAKPLLCNSINNVSNHSSDLDYLILNPNPSDEYIRIQNIKGTFDYSVYDFSGKTLYSGQSNADYKIDVSSFKTGLYFLEIKYNAESRIFKWLKS
jgi:hypothetical protein